MPSQSSLRNCLASSCLVATLVLLGIPYHADSADLPSPDTYALLETFHGHVCGGSLFGARMGHAAKEALRAAGGEGKLKATVFDLTCRLMGFKSAPAPPTATKP